jgi:RNA polymerase sigma factor (sigma-70 family)
MGSGAIPVTPLQTRPRGAWNPDERLARRTAAGDPRAFAVLYERYHQRLSRCCLSILRDEADAQDALQSTFERALGALQRSQRDAPQRPWLFRIAHNEAITVLRRRPPTQVQEHLGVTHAQSAESVAEGRDRLATLVSDLAQLPERSRNALLMRRRLISDGDRRALRGRRVSAHLRDCSPCADFAAAIPQRRSDLRALVPPLAPAAAAAILAHAGGGAGGHGATAGTLLLLR